MKLGFIVSVLSVVILTGCGHMNVHVDSSSYMEKQRVVVTSSHRKEQTFLYLTDGARIKIDGEDEEIIPWGTSKFIELDKGRHTYSLWFNYMGGKRGSKSGCLNIAEKSTVLIEYKTPYMLPSSGNVEVKGLSGSSFISC